MSTSPFLVRVNSHGLPHSILPIDTQNSYALGPLTATNVCSLYWMLKSVAISYSYTIDGVGTFSTSYTVDGYYEPVERLVYPDYFAKSGSDSGTNRYYQFELQPDVLYLDGNGNRYYDLRLLEFHMPYYEYRLTINPDNSYQTLDTASFSFFGATVNIYLQARQYSPNNSGTIHSISVTPTLWTITS